VSRAELRYPTPWRAILSLTPHLRHGTRASLDSLTMDVAGRIQPAPRVFGEEQFPSDPRFVLAANHYQRKGLWIVHAASLLSQIVRRKYGPGDPPVRWIVTANWPPLRIGPLRFPSPGDWLLPRVAHAISAYPVSFAGHAPSYTAKSLRALLRDSAAMDRPVGLFPEGVTGVAGRLSPALPGTARLLALLARRDIPVLPAGISEQDGRFVIRVGALIPASEIRESQDAGALAMQRIGELI
jgi:hypothetical protein